MFTVEHAAHELIHTAGPPGSDTVAFVRVGWDQDRDPTGRHPLHLLGVPVPGVSQHHFGSVSNPSAKKRLGAVAARERFELWLERRELTLVVGVARRRARPAPPSGMQFLDGDAALAASSHDGIGRPRVDRPRGVVADCDLAIHSVHLNPYSAARRVAQLQILAERLPTGYNVVVGDFNLARRLGVGQTVAARQTVAGRAARGGRAAPKRIGMPAGADLRCLLEQLGANPRGWRSVFASPNGWNDGVRGTVVRKLVDPSCGLVTHQA